MTKILTVTRVDDSGEEDPREIPEDATLTTPLPDEVIRSAIAQVVRRSDDLAVDLALAVEVRTRLARDTGERIPLAAFIRQEGFDPADFGVE